MHNSVKLLTFALAKRKDRDLAQLVAHTSGGREVAGSSPVIPTKRKAESQMILSLFLSYASLWQDIQNVENGLFLREKDGQMYHRFANSSHLCTLAVGIQQGLTFLYYLCNALI